MTSASSATAPRAARSPWTPLSELPKQPSLQVLRPPQQKKLRPWPRRPSSTPSTYVSESRILKKYGGLVFEDEVELDDGSTEKETFTVHPKDAEWRIGRGGGWVLICMPSNYVGDGEHDDMLEPMHLEHVNERITEALQPPQMNVKVITSDDNELD